MPNRILKESICTSDTLASVSAEAERLWWRIVAQADDFGRFDARPEVIRGQCLTALLDQVTNDQVREWLSELGHAGLLLLYAVEGKSYLQITTWDKHQKRRAKFSKFPAPADACRQLRTDEGRCKQAQAIAGLVVVEERGTRNEERGVVVETRARESTTTTSTATADADYARVTDFWQTNGFGIMAPLTSEKLRAYVDDGLEVDLVLWALEEAVAAGSAKQNLAYVVKILERCTRERITTRKQAEAQGKVRSGNSRDTPAKPKTVLDPYESKPQIQLGGVKRG